MEEWYREASLLLDRAKALGREEMIALKYFAENISVGVLRAEMDLKRKGLSDPKAVLDRLVEAGLLEKGEYSYSLSKPLRKLRARRGRLPI